MGNKSNSSGQVISLPKGGGALHGIGEKFSPDLHTGTGNFSVPIALPPGRNGFQPQLNLVYSTGSGNGPFGLGWNLSVPGVNRKTSHGIPQYKDYSPSLGDADTIILSGVEDLVPLTSDDPDNTQYRPRTEGLFARINHHHSADDNYWEVRSKDGLVSLYGTPRPDSAPKDWSDPAVVRNPDPLERSHIFAWKLTRTTDPFGNHIDYLYERDANPTEDAHYWDQIYLSEIRYVDYGEPKNPQFLVTIKFTYEDRPDHFSEYRSGFEIRTVRRCSRIDVFTHADSTILTRSYHFIYLDQRGLSIEQLPLNGVSLLSQVQVEGRDGDESEKLPPLEFGYTRFEPESRKFFPVTGQDLPAGSLARPDHELVDLFGNGLPDILEMNGTVRYWRNRGNGRFDLPREMKSAPAGFGLADKGVQLVDANGDGRVDLMVTTDGLAGYFPLRFGGMWDARSFQRYQVAPSFDLKDPEVRLVDLDGDGVTDAIRSGSRLECFFNDPKEGWNRTRCVERQSLDVFPNINFSDPRVKWADMTADGLQDIVLVYDGRVEYWPNLGRGNWGNRIAMHNSPRFPFGYDPRRILVGDVDGDGLADLVYVDDTQVTLWINQSGNRWSDPIIIHGTPPVSDMDAIRLADLLGTGVSGVLWSADATGLSRETMFFLDFTGGIKPYLLDEMDNHLGSVTRVGYAASTRYYLDDERRAETRWKTPLPFPVQVVARVEVIDAISRGKLTTEYRYHHGYWDGVEREFRGFGRVDHRDTEVFEDFHSAGLHSEDRPFEGIPADAFSPPTETRTWFHQGAIEDELGGWAETDFTGEFWSGDLQVLSRPQSTTDLLKSLPRGARRDALRTLRGSVLRTELYALDATPLQGERPYTVTEHLYGVRDETRQNSDEEDVQHIFFPHALAERTTQWERGDNPMTQFKFTGTYDAYGQPLSQISIAVPRSRGRNYLGTAASRESYLATQGSTTYGKRDDADRYIVDRVTQTTAYEILNDGGAALFDLKDAIEAGTADRRIIGKTLNFYDGLAYQGLRLGEIAEYGALVRTESLVLTEDILQTAYESERPPYFKVGGPPVWTGDYPDEFQNLLPVKQRIDTTRPDLEILPAGYGFAAADPYSGGHFAATERRRYDFQDDMRRNGRGLIESKRDPLGRDAVITYDTFDLLPTRVTDPAGLTTRANYDYRVLQPAAVTDPNGNQSVFSFSPLGLLKDTSIKGKAGEGDQRRPSVRMEYAFRAFADRGEPISVRTIKHIHHDAETDIPLPERNETIESIEYSDGFGRLLQTRTQAEDTLFGEETFGGGVLTADQTDKATTSKDIVGQSLADGQVRVVVSGWQVYDNKGQVVEKYEPFFSTGWDYARPTGETDETGPPSQFGQKAILYYDPRGHVIRTVNPDGSEQRVIYGVPFDLTSPEQFAPTRWEVFTYDANDNAGRTHLDISLGYQDHWNTPASAMVDALGRTVRRIERNGPDSKTDWFTTRSTYDIRGNLLTVKDALGRVAFKHFYDLANRQLRVVQLDAGTRRTVLDAAGNVVEQRDEKGALILHAYDILNRPVRLWARDESNDPVTLREELIYGDGADSGFTIKQAADENLLGKLYRHHDEAGLLVFDVYDFKGNVLEKVRQVVDDDGNALDPTLYETSIGYDALNRVKTMLYPRDVEGTRKELRPHYNRAGALDHVELDQTTYVERIAYNTKGQRTLIAYGNGVMTRYAYDFKTFRLARMRTERYTKPDQITYRPAGAVLQDFAYSYDLAGNILRIEDRTPGCGVLNNPDSVRVTDPQLAQLLVAGDALVRRFEYDPLYRLTSATGRECKDIPSPRPWTDDPRCGFNSGNHGTPNQDSAPNLTAVYREEYKYDPAGNMVSLKHSSNGNAWIRSFGMGGLTPQQWSEVWPTHLSTDNLNGATDEWKNPPGNRLTHVGDNDVAIPQTHFFDANGNLIRENLERHFEWDHSDRMRGFRVQPGNAEPSIQAEYFYDSTGQRVKKVVRKQSGEVEVTVYIDAVFEHHRIVRNNSVQENNTLHVMDTQNRVAVMRVGKSISGDNSPAVQYQLGDHLGNSNVVIDDTGAWVNREELTPYGETVMGSFARKRYRFTGKERDEENKLYYHGARYYVPWLSRWTSRDPIGHGSANSSYSYSGSSPFRFIDPTGREPQRPVPDMNLTVRIVPDEATSAFLERNKWVKGIAVNEITDQFERMAARDPRLKHADGTVRFEVEFQDPGKDFTEQDARALSRNTIPVFLVTKSNLEGELEMAERALGKAALFVDIEKMKRKGNKAATPEGLSEIFERKTGETFFGMGRSATVIPFFDVIKRFDQFGAPKGKNDPLKESGVYLGRWISHELWHALAQTKEHVHDPNSLAASPFISDPGLETHFGPTEAREIRKRWLKRLR